MRLLLYFKFSIWYRRPSEFPARVLNSVVRHKSQIYSWLSCLALQCYLQHQYLHFFLFPDLDRYKWMFELPGLTGSLCSRCSSPRSRMHRRPKWYRACHNTTLSGKGLWWKVGLKRTYGMYKFRLKRTYSIYKFRHKFQLKRTYPSL